MPEWGDDLRSRLAALRLAPAREAEIVEELGQHLEDRYQDLRTEDHGDTEARRLALAELDEHEAIARQMRHLRQAHAAPSVVLGAPKGGPAGDFLQDVRYAARLLRRQPGFAAAAILTLALGIGANTAIFSLVNATLLQRLPVPDRTRLVYVHRGNIGNVFSYPMYRALRDNSGAFTSLAAWGGITASLNADGATDLVTGAIVSGNLFDVLGVRAAQGRLLARSDDVTVMGHPVAVISHQLWQTRFGGRAGIVGQPIRLNGHVFTIVGVAPAGFPGPQLGTVRHVYVPMMMQAIMRPPRAGYSGERNPDLLSNPNNGWLFALGRLHEGVTAGQARAGLEAAAATFVQTLAPPTQPVRILTVPVDEGDPNQRRQMHSVAVLLGGVTAAVLLIACANTANLLLSRTADRRHELALRVAIGASRGRIIRQLLTESVLLGTLGGAVGTGLAWVAVRLFEGIPTPAGALPVTLAFAIDVRVLLFSLALAVTTGILFGVAPALRASRPGLVPALKDAAAEDDQGRRVGLKRLLVVGEVALALPLLMTAGLFARSLQAAHAIDPGIDVEKLVSAPLNINLLRYTRTQGRDFYDRVVERIEQLPGVEAASVARIAVLGGGGRVLSLHVEGGDSSHDRMMSEGSGAVAGDSRRINANVIGPGYFRTLGIRLVLGRDFDPQDAEGRPPVVVMNESAAGMHFPGENPIGRRVSVNGPDGPWREIVGVVRNSKYGRLGEGALPVVYLPLAQNHETGMVLYVRASVSPASLVPALRREIQALEPNLPVPDIQTMTDILAASLFPARLGAWLVGVFGGLALLLAAVGIYGVLAFSISRRTREMGVRVALGARRRDVFLLVVRDGMLQVAIGIVIGLAVGLTAVRSLSSFVYTASPWDVPAYAAVTIILAAVALVACTIPARRAMRVDPMTALRCA